MCESHTLEVPNFTGHSYWKYHFKEKNLLDLLFLKHIHDPWLKNCLNFENSLPWKCLFFFDRERWTGKWSVDKDVDSWRLIIDKFRGLLKIKI